LHGGVLRNAWTLPIVTPLLFLWVLGIALVAALAALLVLGVAGQAPASAPASVFADDDTGTAFLFDGERLVDATPAARALLAGCPFEGAPPWMRLTAWAGTRFAGLAEALARLPAEGRITLASVEGAGPPMLLLAESRGGLTRLSLADAAEAPPAGAVVDRIAQDEIDLLRALAAQIPAPVWRETAEGEVTWANAAYLRLVARVAGPGGDLTWPLPAVFARQAVEQGASHQRARIDLPEERTVLWFDLSVFDHMGGRNVFALPADTTVQAEGTLQSFMQTLARTFAHLQTGLAIFDAARQLVLFNPAMVDLSRLAPEFLIGRPSIHAFFDALRAQQQLPEPKNYLGWRRRIIDLEAAAAGGLYEEVWNLPDGQTYRVTGRPHPNGALALMFEDISSEVSQTRRYRADLELGQAVIDAMDEAVAVFSSAGTLVMTNAAYVALWGHDPAATLDARVTPAVMAGHWRLGSAPTALWDDLEEALAGGAPMASAGVVFLSDGRPIRVRSAALPEGAVLVGFATAAVLPLPAAATAVDAAAPGSAATGLTGPGLTGPGSAGPGSAATSSAAIGPSTSGPATSGPAATGSAAAPGARRARAAAR
jgi:PAS domain-containing protein